MPSNYSVRPYGLGDEEGIVDLLELVFDGWPSFDLKCSSMVHWRWKHEDNPKGKSIIMVAVSDDEIIGCIHSIPFMFKIRDGFYLGYEVVDVAVHPDFRGMGVYSKLDDLKYELLTEAGAYFAYGISWNPIVLRRGTKVGWHYFPHVISYLVRIRDIDYHLRVMPTEKAWLKKYGYHFLKAVNRIKSFHTYRPSSDSKFHIGEIDRCDDGINEFWNKIKNSCDYSVVDEKEYLNWRYCDKRGGEYTVKKVELEEAIIGYIVLRINRHYKQYPVGYIVDLITLPDQTDAANALLADAVHYFDDQDVNIVNYWVVKNHPYEKMMIRYGFLDNRKKFYATYDPLGIDGELEMIKESPAKTIRYPYGYTDAI